jgi:signal transduction histidine kinase
VTGVCHEHLNPLTILSGNLELLSNTLVDPARKKLVDDSHDLCFRIADQITRLKEYTEGVERPFQEEHLSQIAKQAIDIASIEAHREGVTIAFAVEKLPPIQAQRDRLCQAVFNVISNAVTVSVGSEVRVVVGREQSRGFIRIEDTGPGIDPEIQRHIFEPFFSTDPERLGLGLSVTNKIIAEHGGSIEVESLEGRGTAFSLYIPFSAP